MWPFTVSDDKKRICAEVEAAWPIGKQFTYLGRDCVVTRNWLLLPGMGVTPGIEYEYADKLGVMHSRICYAWQPPVMFK